MFSIVCFVGLILVALGASAADAQEVHLQTLSVNGRLYTLPATTAIILDEQPATLAALPGHAAGLQLRWRPATSSPDARGATPELVFSYTLIGTVTATAPLLVLGQGVTITVDKVLDGFDGIDELVIDDATIIAGLVDANGSLYATLVERRDGHRHASGVRARGDADPGRVKLHGPVEQIAGPMLFIQGLEVDTTGALFLDGDGLPISAEAFFGELRINQVIDINHVVWDADTGVLSGGELTLPGYDHTAPLPGGSGAIASGSVSLYGRRDDNFGDGFPGI